MPRQSPPGAAGAGPAAPAAALRGSPAAARRASARAPRRPLPLRRALALACLAVLARAAGGPRGARGAAVGLGSGRSVGAWRPPGGARAGGAVRSRASRSPYEVIGVPGGASKEEVRKSFRRRALTEHPDVNPGDPGAEARFSELVGAYNQIMGDELVPDELMALRVQATKRYRDSLKEEVRLGVEGGIIGSPASVLPAVVLVLLAGFLLWLAQQPTETFGQMGLLPPRYVDGPRSFQVTPR